MTCVSYGESSMVLQTLVVDTLHSISIGMKRNIYTLDLRNNKKHYIKFGYVCFQHIVYYFCIFSFRIYVCIFGVSHI